MSVNSMSNILVFDASSAWCSVALSVGGTLYSVAEMQPRKHAQLILPMIENLCGQANIKPKELDGIAFGKGPGSFTGLRIAISVAQGLSLATGARLYGISSLKALAWQGMKQLSSEQLSNSQISDKPVLAIMNAHMGEVFYAAYRNAEEGLTAVIEDSLCKPEHVDLSSLDMPQWTGAGDGFQFSGELPDSIGTLKSINEETYPMAESMMDLALEAWNSGSFTEAEHQQPVYLRDTVAWKKLAEQPSLLKRN
jgi:tRNA threonylcarbamoyladenosine biosynthesis protein TsaB